jgi:HEAT repeat protein
VRHAGRPKADDERSAVADKLIPLLNAGESKIRREFIWMLSEIGGDSAVAPLGKLLDDKELREDARAALQRIPGNLAVRPLKLALKSGPEDYRPAIAVSLRARGEKVSGYPSEKLVPTKKTGVKAIASAG